MDAALRTLPPLRQVHNKSIYIYSAIWRGIEPLNQTHNSTANVILNGWQLHKHAKELFRCCFMRTNGSISASNLTNERQSWAMGDKKALRSTQYRCYTNSNPKDIQGVTIAVGNTSCAKNSDQYSEFIMLKDQVTARNKIAVCSKIAYGSLSAARLIEWFEAHRYLGVSKVLSYVYNLNHDTLNVLKYYQSLGVAEVLEFDIPETGKSQRTC